MGFRFRKIYADLVTADGTVCIAYLAWAETWGLRSAFAGVELYAPDGSREVLRALPPAPQPPPAGDGRPVELRLEFPRGAFSLRYRPLHGPWTPAGDAPARALEWSVRVPRAEVEGRWSGGIDRPDLAGTGYVDWVELGRPTRWAGVRRLEWGRVHLPESTLVFTGVCSPAGEWWRQAARWSEPGQPAPAVARDFRLDPGPDVVRLEFPEPERSAFPGLALRPDRVLHRGVAVDRARSPALLERLAFRLVTGPSDETRWISRAHPADRPDAPAGFALHEVVRFGR
jgi:hypothetical protein